MNKARLFVALAAVIGIGSAMALEAVPNRLATAKAGEWASYGFPNGYTQKQTVISREGDGAEAMVTVRIEDIYENEVVQTREISRPAGEPMTEPEIPDDPNISVDIRQDNTEVKGKTLAATVIVVDKDYDDEDDERSEWWISSEIPVFGIIKVVADGETRFEIVDFGE